MNEQTIPTQEPSFAEESPESPQIDETIETEVGTSEQDETLEEEFEEELIIEDFTIDGICGVY